MIEGINLLISIFIGCIVFIYYTNALFKPRTKYLYANISIIVGYMMLYAISSFYQPTLNVIAFSIATFVLMYLCFKVTLKNAIIQAFMLTAIMMLAEGLPLQAFLQFHQHTLLPVPLTDKTQQQSNPQVMSVLQRQALLYLSLSYLQVPFE